MEWLDINHLNYWTEIIEPQLRIFLIALIIFAEMTFFWLLYSHTVFWYYVYRCNRKLHDRHFQQREREKVYIKHAFVRHRSRKNLIFRSILMRSEEKNLQKYYYVFCCWFFFSVFNKHYTRVVCQIIWQITKDAHTNII